jgi:hypothetical protein
MDVAALEPEAFRAEVGQRRGASNAFDTGRISLWGNSSSGVFSKRGSIWVR